MGSVTIAANLLPIIRKANENPAFRQQLQANPRQELERMAGRKLSDAEVDSAMQMMKTHGLSFTAAKF
jgi:hypothetical protein